MKTTCPKLSLVLFSIFSLFLHSCVNDNPTNSYINFDNFDFKTTKEIKVSVSTLNATDKPIAGVNIEIYTENPLTPEGVLKENSSEFLAFKGISTTSGTLDCEIAPQTFVDSLSILINHVGLPSFKQVKISSNTINVIVGGSSVQKTNKSNGNSKTTSTTNLPEPVKISNYYVLGAWDIIGKPNYLWNPDDIFDAAFLPDVNATLPERKKLPEFRPEYFTSKDAGDIVLIKDAEVWITFVHEGTGFKNVLGYYTHKNDIPPATKAAITDKTIIFPNASYGTIRSGNKVQLLYLDPATNKYTKIFPAGTTVAWFLITNGFTGSTSSLGAGIKSYFSDVRFNPEINAAKKKHNVILKDAARQRFLIGFEDLFREGATDDDFNDVVFYTTLSPYSAARTEEIKPIEIFVDTDKDGVGDSIDEYPTDPNRAFNNYYPSKDNLATLVYEDLWPSKGDYDFNDLVVDYNFNQITNGSNKIVEINATLSVRAIGASLKNGFSLEFNTTPGNVKSVTGQNLTNSLFTLNANGTEQRQSKAVVPIFDDPYKVLGGGGSIVNTYSGGAYITPKTMNVKIEFVTPIVTTNFGTAPYNPFIVVGGVRGKEIHLPANAPTDLADTSRFGTGDDDSNLALKKYYMSDNNLPWAINIPVQFAYPAEKQDITKGFLNFNRWATSKGTTNADWYLDKVGYRDTSKLFKK